MGSDRQQTFQSVITNYEAALWRVVYTYEVDPDQQQELFQEILLSIWKALDNFKALSSVQTFIYRVAHNTALNHLEKQSRRLKSHQFLVEPKCESSDPEATLSQSQASKQLTVAVRRLPLKYRQLVSLSLEGMTYPEIAEVVGQNANQVGVTLSRARQKLKVLFKAD